jgi:uncharacterized protein
MKKGAACAGIAWAIGLFVNGVALPALQNRATCESRASAIKSQRAGGLIFDLRRYTANMDRQTALELLAAHKPVLISRFGVAKLALFGSTARDAAHQGSDIDVLVDFDGPASSAQYFGVLFYLEDVLGCAVDLVTQKALRREIRPYVEREAVVV